MKKIIFSITLLIAAISLAQTESPSFITSGTYELIGSINVGFSDSERTEQNVGVVNTSTRTNIGFAPQLGYALKDNLVLGLGLSYQYSKGESFSETSSDDFNASQYGIATYLKKYFSINEKLALSLQGEVRYSWSESDQDRNFTQPGVTPLFNSESSSNQLFVGFRPGIAYRINNRFAMQAQLGALGYFRNSNKFDNDFESTANVFELSLNTQDFNLGLTYFFN
ncbi:MAG: autotransporter outer membrane beta-barrel domain-containing protein [Nonlabens sp.]|nr:autotransporter outer membrane beta-barrel domain-containing protein [Nonlabens sp.]